MADEIVKPSSEQKIALKERHAAMIYTKYRIVRFRGAVLYRADDGWEPLSSDEFARICYKTLGTGIRQTQIKDLQHLFFTSAEDLTKYSTYIAMPDGRVWDMIKLDFIDTVAAEDCIYTTAISPTDGESHRQWLEEIAVGDPKLADDMIQGVAPIFMHKKPFGVFWFVGNGANGKSTLLKSLYAIMGSEPPYTHNRWFSQLTVKQIEDDRHVLSLNGNIANVCLESNDGHIKDTGNYKNIAEHSTFGVRVLGTHETRDVNGNVHSVQNANNIPTFADKTSGTKRRTFIVPFKAMFPQDDTFDEKLFNRKEFLSDLFGEILKTAQLIKRRGYRYRFSDQTIKAKENYDEEVNTAETYFEELVTQEIWGYNSFIDLARDYQYWCDQRSVTALGKKSVAHAARTYGYERKTWRDGEKLQTRYVMEGTEPTELSPVPQRWGMYQKSDSKIELVNNVAEQTSVYDELMKML